MQERSHDRARRAVQIDQSASLPERLDALWEAWVGAFPTVLACLGLDADNVIDLGARRGRGYPRSPLREHFSNEEHPISRALCLSLVAGFT